MQRKKKPFSTLKNSIFQSPKNRYFSKGLTHTFAKKCQFFFFNLNLIKISLEIMLSDFAEKKETFLTIKNRIFQSSKKRTFSKGLTHAFGQKMPFF